MFNFTTREQAEQEMTKAGATWEWLPGGGLGLQRIGQGVDAGLRAHGRQFLGQAGAGRGAVHHHVDLGQRLPVDLEGREECFDHGARAVSVPAGVAMPLSCAPKDRGSMALLTAPATACQCAGKSVGAGWCMKDQGSG